MRWKIILVNGGIVVVLSLVTYFLLSASLMTAVSNPKQQKSELVRSIQAAEARLTLDALQTERWLARQAAQSDVRGVFEAGTAEARADAATSMANQLRDRAVASGEFTRMAPSLVLFVDAHGMGMGRNGSELMRGDAVGQAYPSLARSLKDGVTASAFWVNEQRQEQLLASYAPVSNGAGQTVGAVVVGTPLNDERLTRISQLTSGNSLALVAGEGLHPIAVGGPKLSGFGAEPVKQAILAARGKTLTHARMVGAHYFAAAPVSEFSGAVLIGAVSTSKVASVGTLLWPIFAVGFLGLFLVVIGGMLLGNYLSRPISEIEEGLLLIINGQRDLRFDLKHDELGGLTSRINTLLNAILGVQEDEDAGQ
jgi:hypothetical protein